MAYTSRMIFVFEFLLLVILIVLATALIGWLVRKSNNTSTKEKPTHES